MPLTRVEPKMKREIGNTKMRNIIYIIGLIIVVLVILRFAFGVI